VDSDFTAEEGEGKQEDDSEDGTEEETEEEPEPILGADELLGEVSELFDAYRDALSDGDWEKAGEIMSEIETLLQEQE